MYAITNMHYPWHLYLMSFLYIIAGLNHFRVPRLYLKMMPEYIPKPMQMVYLSGIAECGLGFLLLVPGLTAYAAWGIIILLVAVFPANIKMYLDDKASLGLPKWVRLIRLPLQLVLIYWAYQYTFLH
ncbi:DoxX family protein [Flavobacterium sp. '19STA2R22 D10 B1']|uniref:DoxX family protein n=1 Tax=Flavobacterium aerium TaxID=3037261 RepID=UPI00278C7473|nr:DoxX family protein [Flavobacterium sp. '19STA2R22 D10 B1']